MDLSKLSDADLNALAANDLTKVSDAGLSILAGDSAPVEKPKTQEQMVAEEAKSRGWLERNLAGAGASAADIYYGLKDITTGLSPQDEQAVKDWRAIRSEAPVGATVGDVGAMILPAGAITKAGMIPKLGLKGATALGATGGAVQGALLPTIGDESRAQNAGMFAVAGGLAPTLIKGVASGVGGAKNLVAPYFKSGQEIAQGNVINRLVGADKVDATINQLRSAKPMLPNQPMTAAEASIGTGGTAIPALTQAVKGREPDAWQAIKEAQRAVRTTALQGGDEAVLAAERKTVTDPLRESALKLANDVDMIATSSGLKQLPPVNVNSIVDGINKKLSIPAFAASEKASLVAAVRDKIASLADKDGVINSEAIYTVRKEIGDMVGKLVGGTNPAATSKYAAKITKEINPLIDDAIDKASGGGWNKYLKTYEAMSRKVDQAAVLKQLSDTLNSPITGAAERAVSFNQAIRNAPSTIKKSTGFGGYSKLEEILTPEQLKNVKSIELDLNRQSKVKELAASGKQKVANEFMALQDQVPNIPLLNRAFTLFNTAMRRIQTGASDKTMDQLAITLQDPIATAKIMEKATKSEKNAIKALQSAMVNRPQLFVAVSKGQQQ